METDYDTIESQQAETGKGVPVGVWIGIGVVILIVVILVMVIIIATSSKNGTSNETPVPITPAVPATPITPTAPVTPTVSTTPTVPTAPAIVPDTPTVPVTPVVPTAPAIVPVTPVVPTAPTVPVTPPASQITPAVPMISPAPSSPLPPLSTDRFLVIPTDTVSLVNSSKVYVPTNPSIISYIRRYPTKDGRTIALKYFSGYDTTESYCYASDTGNAVDDAAIQVGWMIINRLNRPVTLYFRNLASTCDSPDYLTNRLPLVTVPAGMYTTWYMVPYSNGTYPLLSVGCAMEILDSNKTLYKKSKDITSTMGNFIVYEIQDQ